MANGIEAVATAETFPRRTWHLPSAVTGLVRRPGIYELPARAGGMTAPCISGVGGSDDSA